MGFFIYEQSLIVKIGIENYLSLRSKTFLHKLQIAILEYFFFQI